MSQIDADFQIANILRWHTRDEQVFDHSNDTVVVTRTLLNNAADEIERLRAALQRIKDHGPNRTSGYPYGVAFAALQTVNG